MTKPDFYALITLPIIVLMGLGVAFAGGQNGFSVFGVSVFVFCVGLVFVIQWVAFIPAYLTQSERFFDLVGGFTYILVIALSVFLSAVMDGRSLLLLTLVVVWAGRLGLFLFRRIHKAGRDDRFDEIKVSFVRFLNAWTLQGLWVAFTLAAALGAVTTTMRKELDGLAVVGFLIWLFGFVIEVVADDQKSRFREDPKNKGKFIQSGLWSKSRHPNYFGEIVLWIGVAVIALPVLQGWQWVTLISPVFVAVLITKVSGIPMLEKKADKKWGGQSDYEAYKAKTPILILWP
jgi:steroid 5-alpha reductase family enzyme